MGNNYSRVAPTRTSHIVDSQMRVRYKNQHELVQLRVKLKNIDIQQNQALARLAYNRHDLKMKLHELQHEHGQRELFKRLNRRSRQNSVSFVNESVLCDESNPSTLDSSSLLLHNLNASMEWEKSFTLSNKSNIILNKPKLLNPLETLRSRYSSKLDTSHNSFEQSELLLLNDSLSLKQHTERMKKSIKMSVEKASRNSNVITRRNVRIN